MPDVASFHPRSEKHMKLKETPKCIDTPLCVFQDEFLCSIRYSHQQIMEHLTGARTRGHA